jgi:hypothetical protein
MLIVKELYFFGGSSSSGQPAFASRVQQSQAYSRDIYTFEYKRRITSGKRQTLRAFVCVRAHVRIHVYYCGLYFQVKQEWKVRFSLVYMKPPNTLTDVGVAERIILKLIPEQYFVN